MFLSFQLQTLYSYDVFMILSMLSYIFLRSCVSSVKSNNSALFLKCRNRGRVVCSFLHTSFVTFNNMANETGKDRGDVGKQRLKANVGIFRNWVTADGEFQPEEDRYHLYVSLACPFAHRTIITRKLKGLEDAIGLTVVDYLRDDNGWSFTDQRPKTSLDTVNNCKYLREVYKIADPNYAGRITVPVLWDKKSKTIVNNESAEVLRILNKQFNAFSATEEQRNVDLTPDDLLEAIEEINSWVAKEINEGVYYAGFATAQEAYDEAVIILFKALDRVEDILSRSRYLCGDRLTEADIRLFTTLIRFDVVYVHHFKCNKKRIVDYPNLWGFTRDIYQTKGIGDTVDQEHIQKHYQMVHRHINPTGIVAIGPDLDYDAPHGRDVKFQK